MDNAREYDDENSRKAWKCAKPQILGLFVEEHLLSFQASHWRMPANLDKKLVDPDQSDEWDDDDRLQFLLYYYAVF